MGSRVRGLCCLSWGEHGKVVKISERIGLFSCPRVEGQRNPGVFKKHRTSTVGVAQLVGASSHNQRLWVSFPTRAHT